MLSLRRWVAKLVQAMLFVGLSATSWGEVTTLRPIPPEEFAMERPKLDPDAGAEVLLREIRVFNSATYGVEQYFRVKIFDQRGVDAMNPIEFEVPRGYRIRDMEARVITPSGEVRMVDKDEIYKRETFRLGDRRVNTQSFSFPGLEPGAIVEYQWKSDLTYAVFMLAGKFPTHLLRFNYSRSDVRDRREENPVQGTPYEIEDKGNRRTFIIRDLAALPKETELPGRLDYQPWIAFQSKATLLPAYRGKALSYRAILLEEEGRPKVVREKARELTQGIESPGGKVMALYTYCTHAITNLDRTTPVDLDLREEKRFLMPSHVIERGYGRRFEINLLFAALVDALDLEVEIAWANDRSFGQQEVISEFALRYPDDVVAVRLDGTWRLFDPGTSFLPFGMLYWTNEFTDSVVAVKKEFFNIRTTTTPVEASVIRREANVALDAEGNLTGQLRWHLTGHPAIVLKTRYHGLTPEAREAEWREAMLEGLPDVEMTGLSFVNLGSPDEAVEVFCAIRVPGYAYTSGRTLFVAPSVFEQGRPPRFEAATRRSDVSFRFPHLYRDIVRIEVPDGFTVDSGEGIPRVGGGDWFDYQTRLGMLKGQRTLYYERNLRINVIQVPQAQYPLLKTYFDLVHEKDQHIVAFRTQDADESSETASTAP